MNIHCLLRSRVSEEIESVQVWILLWCFESSSSKSQRYLLSSGLVDIFAHIYCADDEKPPFLLVCTVTDGFSQGFHARCEHVLSNIWNSDFTNCMLMLIPALFAWSSFVATGGSIVPSTCPPVPVHTERDKSYHRRLRHLFLSFEDSNRETASHPQQLLSWLSCRLPICHTGNSDWVS